MKVCSHQRLLRPALRRMSFPVCPKRTRAKSIVSSGTCCSVRGYSAGCMSTTVCTWGSRCLRPPLFFTRSISSCMRPRCVYHLSCVFMQHLLVGVSGHKTHSAIRQRQTGLVLGTTAGYVGVCMCLVGLTQDLA